MKKALVHTKCTVKLRKSEYREEWYLIIESYPVYKNGSQKPSRVLESLNRMVTTPVWDKNRTARTSSDGSSTYKPKRDSNGVIICKSKADQDSCIYADNVRSIRQHEYDSSALYTNDEAAQAEHNEKMQCNFLPYMKEVIAKRHKNSSQSIITNWIRAYELLKLYTGSDNILFSQIDISFMEDFKLYLMDAPCGGNKKGTISQNTASTYFSIFKAALKQAFVDGYLMVDISSKVKNIASKEVRREYLTLEELEKLANTECNDIIKGAALFSALTSLRHIDIQQLLWSDIKKENGRYRMNFTQEKTDGVEYQPISEQAYLLCGTPRDPDQLVFEGLPDPSWINAPVKKWVEAAGIKKKITFHCFRHSFATNQLAEGTDLFTISKMMGHTNVKTTQIYTKVVDEKKEKAADALKLNLNLTTGSRKNLEHSTSEE